MAATKPQPTQPRPTAGTYAAPTDNLPAHSAYDVMATGPEVTGADGDTFEPLRGA
jgi:hypothetical protein